MTKIKHKLRGLADTKPLGEPPSNKSEGGFLVSQLEHETKEIASATVDNQISQSKAIEFFYDIPASNASVVQEPGKLRFIFQGMTVKKDLENEAARQAGALAAKRHLNLHQIMRSALGGFRNNLGAASVGNV